MLRRVLMRLAGRARRKYQHVRPYLHHPNRNESGQRLSYQINFVKSKKQKHRMVISS